MATPLALPSLSNCIILKPSFHRIPPRTTLVPFNGDRHAHKFSSFEKSHSPISVLAPTSKFLRMDYEKSSFPRLISVKSLGAESGGSSASPTISQRVCLLIIISWVYSVFDPILYDDYLCLFNVLQVFGIFHLVVSLGIILATDKLLKKAFVAAAIKFPSALFGMFCIFSILTVLDSTIPAAAKNLESFFEPALLFIQRWLPLFYVPSLVVLPLSVRDIPAASGLKICYIIGNDFHASFLGVFLYIY